MSERLKKNNRLKVGTVLSDKRGRTIPVAALLVFVVLLSAGSGMYAGASFFAQQAPNLTVTTTIYTTTTSWTTSTMWSTLTETAYGILTTIEYTTSTSTTFVTASSSSSTRSTTSTKTTISTRIGTTITITSVTGASGTVTVKGYLKNKNGAGLQGLGVRITVDGGYGGRITTTSGGAFSYTGTGPSVKGTHYVTVWFDGNSQYASSSATRSYSF